jgi:hypothetical protein
MNIMGIKYIVLGHSRREEMLFSETKGLPVWGLSRNTIFFKT